MTRITINKLPVYFTLLFVVLFVAIAASAQDKPLLSAEIQKVLDAEGIVAAKQHFAELYPSRAAEFSINMQDMMLLGNQYMQSGNQSAGMAVLEMAGTVAEGMMNSNPMFQEMMSQDAEQGNSQGEEKQPRNEVKQNQSQGLVRDDLDLFTGLYGDPQESNEHKRLWVMPSCNGHLVVGALWGDVSPWWMKSENDARFSYSDSFLSIEISFNAMTKGKAGSMSHNLGFMPSPLKLMGSIPEGWGSCVEDRR